MSIPENMTQGKEVASSAHNCIDNPLALEVEKSPRSSVSIADLFDSLTFSLIEIESVLNNLSLISFESMIRLE